MHVLTWLLEDSRTGERRRWWFLAAWAISEILAPSYGMAAVLFVLHDLAGCLSVGLAVIVVATAVLRSWPNAERTEGNRALIDFFGWWVYLITPAWWLFIYVVADPLGWKLTGWRAVHHVIILAEIASVVAFPIGVLMFVSYAISRWSYLRWHQLLANSEGALVVLASGMVVLVAETVYYFFPGAFVPTLFSLAWRDVLTNLFCVALLVANVAAIGMWAYTVALESVRLDGRRGYDQRFHLWHEEKRIAPVFLFFIVCWLVVQALAAWFGVSFRVFWETHFAVPGALEMIVAATT